MAFRGDRRARAVWRGDGLQRFGGDGAKRTARSFYYVIKQAIWTSIGFVVMLLAMQFNYHRLRDRRVVYGLLHSPF